MRLGSARKDYNFDFFFEQTSKQRRHARPETESKKASTAQDGEETSRTKEEAGATAAAGEVESRLGSEPRNAESPDVTSSGSWEVVDDIGDYSSSSGEDDDDVMDEDAVLVFEKMIEAKLKVTEKDEVEETRAE